MRRRVKVKSPAQLEPAEHARLQAHSQDPPSLLAQVEATGALVAVEESKAAIGNRQQSIACAVTNSAAVAAIKRRAKEWAELCCRDLHHAALEALNATFELGGLPSSLTLEDLDEDPRVFLARLPDVVRERCLDLAAYPLSPSTRQGKRSVNNFERFWALGVGEQNSAALLESGLMALLVRWLLVMPQAAVRSVRHAASVAALAVAGALGHHHQSLRRLHDTSKRQLAALSSSHSARQIAQLKRDVSTAAANAGEVHNARTQLLETTVPSRSRDVSDVIRLYTLCEVDRLMKQDFDMFLQNKWTARVFLMIHDPSVEVRLKAVSVIHQWYSSCWKKSQAVQEHLGNFAQRCLSHLVERVGDVDVRVATAALRCLRLPALAERLHDEEFDMIVNLCIGSQDLLVRDEAALFINAHVFQDPGICAAPGRVRHAVAGDAAETPSTGAGGEVDADEAGGGEAKGAGDVLRDLYNSETSLSMLVEYLDNYVGDHLRVTDRVVGAFWGRAPALTHWSTMVNLCLVGESSQRAVSLDPVSPQQRLALLYIMEAAIRRAREDAGSAKPGEREVAVTKLNDACGHILPEMPRLLDICRPEEQHSLLLSHACKILVEWAVENAHHCGVLALNVKALCEALQRVIEAQTVLDTVKYCTDAFLALARCSDEAKAAFLGVAKAVHRSCADALNPGALREGAEDVRARLNLFVVLSNRGLEMTFGKAEVLDRIFALLHRRIAWMRRSQRAAGTPHEESPDDQGTPAGEHGQQQERPGDVPDARLALLLLEAAATTVMWHVRMAFWVETQSERDAVPTPEAQVYEMLQGFCEIPTLRAGLPTAVLRLRQECLDLITADSSPYVRFHAYSGYMCLLHLALGVSEKLSLEVLGTSEGPTAPSWGRTHEVRCPEAHMKVLWQYLNSFYARSLVAGADGLTFNSEGHQVATQGAYPAPSQGTMTSARFLTQQCMQSAEDAEGSHIDAEGELLLAVLASRSVLESEIEDVYAGPLGLLLLTQCERSRPKPLRDIALSLFRRLRELARTAEDFAVQFYRMQQEAVSGLFDCTTVDAAAALSAAFMKHAGPRIFPWLEIPLYKVLKEATLSCVAEDRRRLPLLEVFGSWFKAGFVQDSRCREIVSQLLQKCSLFGFDGRKDPHVAKFLQRVHASSSLSVDEADSAQIREEGIAIAQGSHGPLRAAGTADGGTAKRRLEHTEVLVEPTGARPRREQPTAAVGEHAQTADLVS